MHLAEENNGKAKFPGTISLLHAGGKGLRVRADKRCGQTSRSRNKQQNKRDFIHIRLVNDSSQATEIPLVFISRSVVGIAP